MGFDVIPVIDLKGGKAVRGQGGDRANYRPLATPLCPDGAPLTAAAGFLGLHPFARLYLADLDAIEGRGSQDDAIAAIHAAFPALEPWVDAGFADAGALAAWTARGLGRPVLGSESLADIALPRATGAVLSLDFRGDRFLGNAALLAEPVLWPRDVIVMCLHDVGAGGGPDLARLARVIAAAGPERRVHAAGGVRHGGDLRAIAGAGAAGVLVASALHDGAIASADLTL